MRWLVIVFSCWSACTSAQVVPVIPMPLEHFTRFDEFDNLKISPDGKTLAFTTGRHGRAELACMSPGGNKVNGLLRMPEGYEVEAFDWVSPTQLVYVTKSPRSRQAQPRTSAMMYAADSSCQKAYKIYGNRTPPKTTGTNLPGPAVDEFTPRFLSAVKADPGQVMITEHPWLITVAGVYYRDPDAVPRIGLVNVATGKRKDLGVVPQKAPKLLVDTQGGVRFAVGRQGSEMRMLWRAGPDTPWERLDLSELVAETVTPRAFSSDGKRIFVTAVAQAATHSALYSIDPAQQKVELVHAFEGSDVERVVLDLYGSGEVIGLMSAADKPTMHWLDGSHPTARAYKALQKAFPGQDVIVTSATDDGSLAIVRVSSEVDPGSYYLFDTRGLRADFLRAGRAWLEPTQMLPKQPMELTARDGLKLDAYVTTPRGEGPFPTVLLPHDGPNSRDTRAFDPTVQLLASRGYAVLQVNYRGSSGRGLRFAAAGDGEWGARMQDDLTDATRWAVGQRIADPKRICIFGSGYGGYAALMGAIREPKLYQCAIGFGGYYDLELLIEDRDFGFEERQYFQRTLGRDLKILHARSPVHSAAGIEAPVLLVHGEQDFSAGFEQARRMHSELRRLGKPVELLALKNESHEIYDPQTRRDAYQRILDFLKTHLQTGAEP